MPSAGLATATPVPIDDSIPDEQTPGESLLDDGSPLIDPVTQTTLPAGCIAPRPATLSFLGELISTDDLVATFRVEQVRGGSLGAYANNGLIMIRYLERETRFLDIGKTYLVGAGASEMHSTLESKVRENKQLFGGDAVVGIDESDLPCPKIEDPRLTLMPNGELINAGIFSLLGNDRSRLLQALTLPFVLVFIFLVGLVVIKRLMVGAGRSFKRHSR